MSRYKPDGWVSVVLANMKEGDKQSKYLEKDGRADLKWDEKKCYLRSKKKKIEPGRFWG